MNMNTKLEIIRVEIAYVITYINIYITNKTPSINQANT